MVTFNGRSTFDQMDADRLHSWVTEAESQFTSEEHRRARKSVAYLRSKLRGPGLLMPRINLSSVINLAAVFIVLVCLISAGRGSPLLAELRTEYTGGEVFQGSFTMHGGYLLTFLCFAGMTVGWPKWLRAIIAVVGFSSLLWAFVFGMILIVSAKGAVGGFAALVFIGLIVWFIFLVAKSGNR